MLKAILVTTTVSLGTLITQDALADFCQKLTVVSPDGYANIRSQPNAKTTILGVLVTGTGVQTESEEKTWVKIKSPIRGWIAKSQINTIPCDEAMELLVETGLPTMNRLGKQAINNNINSAKTLINMSIGVDGLVAESYAIMIADWAKQNPRFLISILEKQSSTTRRAFLDTLNLSLTESEERENFEKVLRQLPLDNLVLQDWQYLNKK